MVALRLYAGLGDLPATRLPSPGTWSGFNAGMRGNGGQVAMYASIVAAQRGWRWQAGGRRVRNNFQNSNDRKFVYAVLIKDCFEH